MKVTAKMLRNKSACEEQVVLFEQEWPHGAEVTQENCLRALELGLHIHWFALSFLKGKRWAAYANAVATAWEVYRKAKAIALADILK